MPNEHLIFTEHLSGSFPAWGTPDKAIPVASVTLAGSRALDIHDDTGATTRSRAYKSQGAVNASGTITMRAYPRYLLPFLFRSFLTDVDVNAAGAGYDNDLLPNDLVDVQLPWFSFQKYYSSTVAENVRGAVIQKLTLACAGGEVMNVTADFVAADIAKAGGTWSDGSASAAVVGSIPYPSPMPTPLRFHEGSIKIGGSASKSGNKLSSSGSAVGTIETFQLEITINTEGRFAVRDGAPTIAYTRHGARDIVFTGDIDWANLSMSYYDDMLAAAETVVRLEFVSDAAYGGSDKYELILTMPRMVWPDGGAPTPQLDGVQMPKKQSLTLNQMQDITTTDTDFGVSFQTLDDLT